MELILLKLRSLVGKMSLTIFLTPLSILWKYILCHSGHRTNEVHEIQWILKNTSDQWSIYLDSELSPRCYLLPRIFFFFFFMKTRLKPWLWLILTVDVALLANGRAGNKILPQVAKQWPITSEDGLLRKSLLWRQNVVATLRYIGVLARCNRLKAVPGWKRNLIDFFKNAPHEMKVA